ncbi:MAG: NAD(+)/NADH kinase [Fusobacteria bacterium]|nr:NAD(+)/NADH kinase [Fusobacteriota bacterium]
MIALIYNKNKKGALELYNYIYEWYTTRGHEVITNIKSIDLSIDFVMVLGGDGTILGTAKEIYPLQIPIIGINLGRLGFLTSVEKENIDTYLAKTLDKNNYVIDERIMLDLEIYYDDKITYKDVALNDVVLSRNYLEGMLGFKVEISDTKVDEFFADGYIISTPTGSTAYSLSAGGPILTPTMEAILLTPVCPHTLYARPIVVDGSANIKITLTSVGRESIISVDGQRHYPLNNNSALVIRKSDVVTKTVRFNDRLFFEVLGEKIGKRK